MSNVSRAVSVILLAAILACGAFVSNGALAEQAPLTLGTAGGATFQAAEPVPPDLASPAPAESTKAARPDEAEPASPLQSEELPAGLAEESALTAQTSASAVTAQATVHPEAQAGPPVAVEGGVLFAYKDPTASSVNLAGEFNSWNPNSIPMTETDGVWRAVVELQPGRSYEYKFVIDGGVVWKEDPNNPYTVDDEHGGVNTVISLTEDGDVVLGYGGAPGGETFAPVVDELPALGTKLYVAIVWHQHQPRYLRDLETGEYSEPWVRMHSIKDYYDMVAILADYPNVRFTVNLTPVLLTQIQDVIEGYKSGGGTDIYLRMTLKNAADLTEDDKIFLLTHFFNANWDNVINIWPRYRQLKEMKGGDTPSELEASAARFTVQDWRDLQAWFNLAWFDPDFQEKDVTLPDGRTVTVKNLIEKGRDYTEADKRQIIDTQIAIMENVVAVHRQAQDRGQIEVTTTPFYHPILPLLCDTDLARVAMPSVALPEMRFLHPEDARAQVRMAVDYYQSMFDRKPEGMWPAEGAVAEEIVGIVADGGFSWMATDDGILKRSLETPYLSTRQKYQMYWAQEGDKRVAAIFRDHRLSDDIGFNFGKMNGVQAANLMMRSLYTIHKELADDERTYVVPIILDGENAWEWYPHDAKEFFHSWYDQMNRASFMEAVTVSDYLAKQAPTETLDGLWAGSWINADFSTWIGEPEENLAWDYLARVRADLDSMVEASGGADKLGPSFREMYAAEGSDWFWWYGKDQESPLEGDFDRIYRHTLANVYALAGAETPDFLSRSILMGGASAGGGGAMARSESVAGADLLMGPVVTPEGVLFSHKAPGADTVSLAGEFNDWSVTATPMSDDDNDGIWTVVVDLAPGSYPYKFVVNGSTWEPDEGNPETTDDGYGGVNSVLNLE
jgi:alpha-amylase/alpha-mannosidase (GH57 family)